MKKAEINYNFEEFLDFFINHRKNKIYQSICEDIDRSYHWSDPANDLLSHLKTLQHEVAHLEEKNKELLKTKTPLWKKLEGINED